MINVGSRIRKIRKNRGISAKEIAISLGVSSSFISGIEKGTNKCSLENLERICETLGITLGEFFTDPQSSDIPPDLRRLVDKLKGLPPEKINILETVLDTWVETD